MDLSISLFHVHHLVSNSIICRLCLPELSTLVVWILASQALVSPVTVDDGALRSMDISKEGLSSLHLSTGGSPSIELSRGSGSMDLCTFSLSCQNNLLKCHTCGLAGSVAQKRRGSSESTKSLPSAGSSDIFPIASTPGELSFLPQVLAVSNVSACS